jgi:HPt (histidine-containing phosphotransfer) domain-containing protein
MNAARELLSDWLGRRHDVARAALAFLERGQTDAATAALRFLTTALENDARQLAQSVAAQNSDPIRGSLHRTAETCREVERLVGELGTLSEVLENELAGLAAEAGKLNTALGPHRQAGGAA